jgi:hypothetical protein
MNNKNRPFGLTVVDLAITIVVIAIIASAGFWAAAMADGVIDRYAAAEWAKIKAKNDGAVAARAAEVAVTRRVAAIKAHATAGENNLQTSIDCLEYSWAFRDAQRKEESAKWAASRADRAAALAVAQAAEWEAERAMRKQAALGLLVAGQLAEGMGKAQTAGFKASFLRQFGVQLQVVALELTGAHSANPLLATAEGFLIGL